MRIAEKFVSMNGEGVRAGELAVFIRCSGCNLRCSYCDTSWANEKDCPWVEEPPKDLYEYVQSTGVRNVTLTGGEPLLQEDAADFFSVFLEDPSLRVEVETNGAVPLLPFMAKGPDGRRPSFTMDYKLPSSGFEKSMCLENLELLSMEDTAKFVCGSQEDLERAWEMIRKYQLPERCHVYLSPVFGQIEPADMVEFMKQNKMNDIRLQIQMHKVIWDPDQKGV